MTMYYGSADEKYLEQLAAQANQSRATGAVTQDYHSGPLTEIPDISEAERIWKLIVDASVN